MWRQTLLYLGSWITSCLIGYYCGYIVNVVYNVEGYDVIFGFFSLIFGIIITLYFINKANSKKNIYPNQIKVKPVKRLPFY